MVPRLDDPELQVATPAAPVSRSRLFRLLAYTPTSGAWSSRLEDGVQLRKEAVGTLQKGGACKGVWRHWKEHWQKESRSRPFL